MAREKRGITFQGNRILELLGLEPVVPREGFSCSFCGVPVDKSVATFGSVEAPRQVGIDLVRNNAGEVITFQDRIRHSVREVVACKDCCNLVTKVKFPDFD